MKARTELFETFAIQGMSLRDYFAAKAIDYFLRDVWIDNEEDDFEEATKQAYKLADAMMKARETNE